MAPRAPRIVEHRLPESVLWTAVRALHPRCARFAQSCYGYEERSAGEVRRSESANAGVVVILETGAPIRIGAGDDARTHPGGFVAGVSAVPTQTSHHRHQAGVELMLSPLGARLVLGIPLSELAHRIVRASDVLPRAHRELPRRLAELESWQARLDAVEAFVADAENARAPASFRELAWAVAQIERCAGRMRIAELARELGWSERRLQRVFSEEIGVSPKTFARLVRFEALMASVRRGAHVGWAEAAQAFGYSDQSHLVRDVRQFAGVPPSAAALHLVPQLPDNPS